MFKTCYRLYLRLRCSPEQSSLTNYVCSPNLILSQLLRKTAHLLPNTSKFLIPVLLFVLWRTISVSQVAEFVDPLILLHVTQSVFNQIQNLNYSDRGHCFAFSCLENFVRPYLTGHILSGEFSAYCPAQSIPDLFVSQSVHHRVQEGSDNSIGHRNQLILIPSVL